jgi:hypothetical protein
MRKSVSPDLADGILKTLPDVQFTMLDFSPVMHELAHDRLGSLAQKVRSLVVDFKREGWHTGLGLSTRSGANIATAVLDLPTMLPDGRRTMWVGLAGLAGTRMPRVAQGGV